MAVNISLYQKSNNFVITKQLAMDAAIIAIGNSKGIRLPKTILERYKLSGRVELVLKDDCIVIKPVHLPRAGWDDAFRAMHINGDDQLFIPDAFDEETTDEWK